MKHLILAIPMLLLAAISATGQRVAQDNWRFGGLRFGSPAENNLRSIAAGNGSVYVGEVNGANPTKVLQFTEDGQFVRRFDKEFGYIHGIACDAAGNVYVLSRTPVRVSVFNPNGSFLREWGSEGAGDGQFNLEGSTGNTMIAVMRRTGEVYVCDPGNNRVQVFNSAGVFQRKWGQAGSLPGQFREKAPSAIAASDNGHVIIASAQGEAVPPIKVFDGNGIYQTGAGLQNDYGYHRDVGGLAVTGDGLVQVNWAGYAEWYRQDMDRQQAFMLDPAESYQNIGGMPHGFSTAQGFVSRGRDGCAFSKRGDLFAVFEKQVTRLERYYPYTDLFPASPAMPHAMILSAQQRAGTNLVDIRYYVTDADSPTAEVALLAMRDGSTRPRTGYAVPMRTFVEGTAANVGPGQPTGVERHLVWNMPADWAVDYADFEIEIMARDEREPLGVHWITVPASDGRPAIQVSSAPVALENMRRLFLWFLAKGLVDQTYVKLSNDDYGWHGKVWGKSGAYAGLKLCEDDVEWRWGWFRTYPTAAGLGFIFGEMGAHPITAEELARARDGTYGFSSLDNSLENMTIVRNLGPHTSYLKGWGRNDLGQAPWQAFPAPNIVKAAAADRCTFFIRADGTLWGVGENSRGQLGDGTTVNRTAPVQIASGVTEVATGGKHTLFVKSDGSLWAMGANESGQLGDGGTSDRLTPFQLASNVSKAACGAAHSLFVTKDGKLYAMGHHNNGRLGLGTLDENVLTPRLVVSGVAEAGAGAHHSLFIKTDGKLYGMGYNTVGQLGDGSRTERWSPVEIAANVARVAASPLPDGQGLHSLFVTTEGKLYGMGRNHLGQLGDGTTTDRTTPVLIATDVAKVAAGVAHTVFLKTDKTVWSTGWNNHGQLGAYSSGNRSTPAMFDVNIQEIAAGGEHTLTIAIP